MPATPQTWDSASHTWDAPSATWDSVVPAPEPKKKRPFRRKVKPPQPPIPDTTMPTFKYNVAPLSSGGFTTRAARGAQADADALSAQIAATTGVTPAQVPAVIQAFVDKVLLCAAGCDWSSEIYGCLSFRPTSGGSQPQPMDFHNADDLNADVALSISSGKVRDWRATLSLESLGEVGKLTPVVDTILNQANGSVDTYIPGNMIQLRGDHMKLTAADTTQGVFFKAGAAAEVRATVYGTMDPTAISVLVPANLTGPLQVRIATYINGSVRSYTYTNLITQ